MDWIGWRLDQGVHKYSPFVYSLERNGRPVEVMRVNADLSWDLELESGKMITLPGPKGMEPLGPGTADRFIEHIEAAIHYLASRVQELLATEGAE